jgi:uncharacterized protein DUF4255
MSNSLAIAATTEALCSLLHAQITQLDPSLGVFELTTKPPDLARKGITKAQLNLFLYQTAINAAWRNLDPPRQSRAGEVGNPPLALNLHYLITAYGDEAENETVSHRMLGGAMSALHDNALLRREDVRAALQGNPLLDSGIADQFEQLRITLIATPLDEMSKLWTALQTQYRLSANYEVTVVLIDSRTPQRAPLPVLKRGDDDRGPKATAARMPVLQSLRFPHAQVAAQLGDDIAIVGTSLATSNTVVRLTSPRLAAPIVLTPVAGDRPGEIKVHLPALADDAAAMTAYAPGLYTIAVITTNSEGQPLVSNELGFGLAPTIKLSPASAPAGTVDFAIDCTPRIADGQRVLLVVGDRQAEPLSLEVPAAPPNSPSLAKFKVAGIEKNGDGSERKYVVRLRVDGVDSIPVTFPDPPATPAFDPAQQVKIT